MSERYDLTVVGGGPGGYVAAIRAAQLGLRVALVERAELGGICLNWGCIPTKSLLASLDVAESARSAEEFGVRVGDVSIDVPAVFERKDKVVERLRSGVTGLLKKRGVTVLDGEGTVREPGVVVVAGPDGETTLESGRVIVATGSSPLVPGAFPHDGRVVVTSRDVLARSDLPDSAVVIGAGAVGCEFAGFYAGMGVRVTLVEMLPDVLPGEDASAARLLRTMFKKRGIDVRVGTRVESVEVRGERAVTSFDSGDPVESGMVLLAMGRRPSVEGAGLPALGVAIDGGAVSTDDRMMTSVEGVYALGDLVGGWMLAHVASREGIVAASQAAGLDVRMSYRSVPRCTFTRPEIASVGTTEADAARDSVELIVGRFPFSASGKALASGDAQGFVKVFADASSGKTVGGVVVGPHASDLVHEIALAVEAELPAELVADMIHAHPTLSESVGEAFEAVQGLSIHSM